MIMNLGQAVRDALDLEMARDPHVFVIGEDVGKNGCSIGQYGSLQEKYGEGRVVNTPISESVITGMGIGAAAAGLRPVVCHDFIDFLGCCFDELLNQASKLTWMVGGQIRLPMTLNIWAGGGHSNAAQHSQSLEAFFTHMPGLKVAASSCPADAKGLVASAIRDDNPVMVIHNKNSLGMQGEVPEGEYLVPLGRANVVRQGSQVSIVTYSRMVGESLAAAELLEKEGVSAEVVDLRSLVPLDKETVFRSLEKTNRLVVVHEAVGPSGFGAEIAAVVAEEALDLLDAPIRRVTAPFTHIPYSPPLEAAYFPDREKIAAAVRSIL